MSAYEPGSDAGREAAEWLIRIDRGLTPAEQDAFLQWLAADPGHQRWMAEHRRTWMDFDLLAQWQPAHSAEPNPDLLARPRALRGRSYAWWSALAACLAVAAGIWLWSLRAPVGRFPAEYVAGAYEQHVLEDGTVVDFNAGTMLKVRFIPGERRVELVRGEAQFTVAKNPARPFVVRAGGVDVRAVGTAFNVKLAAGDVEVLVTEGRVKVTPPAPASDPAPASSVADRVKIDPAVRREPELIAGQRTVVSRRAGSPPPQVRAASAEEVSRLLAWQPQLLDFDSTPLRAVVAEFNRRNSVQLTVEDEALNSLPIVASFRSDNLEGFVRLLQVGGDVRVERRGAKEIVLRRAR